MVQPLWRTIWRFLKKLRIELAYCVAIPLMGVYPDKIIICKGTSTLCSLATLFTIGKTWKQPKCTLTDEQIKKMWCTYIYIHTHICVYIETLVSNKKNGIMPFAATWIDLEFITLSKESQK